MYAFRGSGFAMLFSSVCAPSDFYVIGDASCVRILSLSKSLFFFVFRMVSVIVLLSCLSALLVLFVVVCAFVLISVYASASISVFASVSC